MATTAQFSQSQNYNERFGTSMHRHIGLNVISTRIFGTSSIKSDRNLNENHGFATTGLWAQSPLQLPPLSPWLSHPLVLSLSLRKGSV